MVDFYGFHVGKYNFRPMDPMGMNGSMHVVQTSSIAPLKVDKISSRNPSLRLSAFTSVDQWTSYQNMQFVRKKLNKQQIVSTSKVGGFSPTRLQNMRKSKWVKIFPNFWGEHEKYLSCHHLGLYATGSVAKGKQVEPYWLFEIGLISKNYIQPT